jgi:hypothetical protein
VPACSAALRKLAVRVDIEAQPPKLGPFIDAINAALSDPRRLGKILTLGVPTKNSGYGREGMVMKQVCGDKFGRK